MDSHTTYVIHHGPEATVRVLDGSNPLLDIDLSDGGGCIGIAPTGATLDYPLTDEHERFADELAAAAEQYRDAIAGARLWAEFEQPPSDVEGAA